MGYRIVAIAADCKSALIEFGGSSPSTPTKNKVMATLETQYKNYQSENPDSTLTFDEWRKEFGTNILKQLEDIQSVKSKFSKIFDEIKSPEYKEKRIKENEEYLQKVSMDWQLGFYVGQDIVHNYLPTLSTDMIHSRNVIQVNEEDGSKEKWELYFQHNKMLEKKYLPQILDTSFGLIRIDDMKKFKDGLIDSLWNCDMCSYNLDEDKIIIKQDMLNGFTEIKFELDENVS